jgi:hypothetical protein
MRGVVSGMRRIQTSLARSRRVNDGVGSRHRLRHTGLFGRLEDGSVEVG